MGNELENYAQEVRRNALKNNLYSDSNNYNETHPNAIYDKNGKDDPNNVKGKGTGTFLDTSKGGGIKDVKGSSVNPGTGRDKLLAGNKYNPSNPHPLVSDSDAEGINIGFKPATNPPC